MKLIKININFLLLNLSLLLDTPGQWKEPNLVYKSCSVSSKTNRRPDSGSLEPTLFCLFCDWASEFVSKCVDSVRLNCTYEKENIKIKLNHFLEMKSETESRRRRCHQTSRSLNSHQVIPQEDGLQQQL